MTEKEYNGWTNYETWLVKLWMDNDEGIQTYWVEQAQESLEVAEKDPQLDVLTLKENAALELRDRLKAEHDGMVEEAKIENGMLNDLLNAAMSEVNWHEIAESLINDVEENS